MIAEEFQRKPLSRRTHAMDPNLNWNRSKLHQRLFSRSEEIGMLSTSPRHHDPGYHPSTLEAYIRNYFRSDGSFLSITQDVAELQRLGLNGTVQYVTKGELGDYC